jgi:hypothetical protein
MVKNPVLYTVALKATYENMNFTVWAVWPGHGSKGNFFNFAKVSYF